MGFGMALGPFITSAVYKILGYTNTFYFSAGLIAFFGLGTTIFIPARLNK